MNQVGVIAAFTLRESLRRRVFLVVALLTLAFLGLYGLGTWQLFDTVGALCGLDRSRLVLSERHVNVYAGDAASPRHCR